MRIPYVPLAACALVAGLTLSLATAQQRTGAQAEATRVQRGADGNFNYLTGTSANGSFQEALDIAIANGLQEASGGEAGPIADGMVQWELFATSGRKGGIAGFNEISVTIRVPK